MKKKVIIFFAILIIEKKKKNSYSNDDISYKTEYVVSGDTLWSIAEQEVNNNEYYKNDDIRTVVYDIKYINNLKNSELKQGMKLKIPVY